MTLSAVYHAAITSSSCKRLRALQQFETDAITHNTGQQHGQEMCSCFTMINGNGAFDSSNRHNRHTCTCSNTSGFVKSLNEPVHFIATTMQISTTNFFMPHPGKSKVKLVDSVHCRSIMLSWKQH